jgi:hypothetical protein
MTLGVGLESTVSESTREVTTNEVARIMRHISLLSTRLKDIP